MNASDSTTSSLAGEHSPISASDKSKLLLFFLLYLPTPLVFGLGVLPGIFLAFGLVMLWRDKDFAHVEVAHRNFSLCILAFLVVALVGCAIGTFKISVESFPYLSEEQTSRFRRGEYQQLAMIAAISISAWLLYRWAEKHLFFLPLQRNQAWLTTSKSGGGQPKKVAAQKLAGGSVAGEIEKLIALKEAGHLTEAEFQTAKETLLARM